MAIVQDTYRDEPARGYPGQVSSTETGNRASGTVEDAAGIAFGAAVFRGSADGGITATPADGADLGFAIADHGQPVVPGGVAADIWPRYDSAPYMTQGAILVTVGGAVNAGDDVTVGVGAGAGDGIGNTAADATHIAMRGWVFNETAAASGEIVEVVRR